MKQMIRFIAISLVITVSASAWAQTPTMELYNAQGEAVKNGAYLSSVANSTSAKILHTDSLFVKNISDAAIKLKVRRTYKVEVAGTFSVFTALGQSVPADETITPNYWDLEPGVTTPDSGFFYGSYYPQTIVGTTAVVYSFLSVDESDKVLDSVYVCYNFSNTSVTPMSQEGEYLYHKEVLVDCDPAVIHEYPILLANHTNTDVSFRVGKTVIQVDEGQESSFKFGEVEYTPGDNNSNASGVFIQANTTLEGTNGFIAKFNGNGIDNNEFFPTVQYKFFNRMSGNDADYVTLVYNVSGVGFSEIKSFEISSAYPNPASSWFSVDFNLPVFTTANLKVYNHTGQLTAVYPIQNQTNSMKVDIENYASGVYFLSIEIDGKQTGVEKLVVQ